MNNRFAPIVPDSPEPRAPLNWIPNFGHAGHDDMAAYSQTLPAPIKSTDYDALVTRNEVRETTIRRMVNSQDQCDAVEWLVARGEISPELAERIEEVMYEMAEKRLNRSQA